MAVHGDDSRAVFELDDVAVAALSANELYPACARRAHRRAHWRRVVDALVRTDEVQYRVPARRIESRTDARELHGRPDECLAQALAVGGEILAASRGIDVAHGAVLAPIIDEFRGENIADAKRFAVLKNLFVYDGEAIARLNVEYEIDVVLKDLGEVERDAIGELRIGRRLEQRILNRRARGTRVNFERILQDIAGEAVGRASYLEGLAILQLALQPDELAAAMHETQ